MTDVERMRCAEAHQATARTRVFCTHTSSSSKPRIASTSIVRRKRVLTSNDIQVGPIVRRDTLPHPQPAYSPHALQTVKSGVPAGAAKIMVTAAFTDYGRLETAKSCDAGA